MIDSLKKNLPIKKADNPPTIHAEKLINNPSEKPKKVPEKIFKIGVGNNMVIASDSMDT